MNRLRLYAGLLTLAASALPCTTASAFFHLWRFTEFFSNADGTVQFIELRSSGPAETLATGAVFRSASTGKEVTLTTDLAGSTLNKNILLATPGFADLIGAVQPDFQATPLPVGFFNPTGDTVTLFHHQLIDSRTFTPANPVPTDGVLSRVYPSNILQFNSPTNFAGQTGSLNLSVFPGDYNDDGSVDAADYVIWRANNGTTNVIPNDLTPEWVMEEDYVVWRDFFGNTEAGARARTAAVPEPASLVLGIMLGLLPLARSKRRMLSSAAVDDCALAS